MHDDLLLPMAIPHPPWRHYLAGRGRLVRAADGSLRLLTADATARQYSDAQVDDYRGRAGERFMRRPPLRLRLRARFSHEADALRGTAGFGFWNYPFAVPPGMPRALWFFFGSAPNDMPLALGVPGQGWKAATLDTGRRSALALLPLAPFVVPLLRYPALYRGLWPPLQRAVGVAEVQVRVPMTEWHEYVIEWGKRTSRFLIDGRVVMDEVPSPRGPMCCIAWLDNQYLEATPQGRFRWGLLDVPGVQWLALREVGLTADH